MRTTSEKALREVLDSDWVRSQFYSPVDPGDEDEAKRINTLRYQTTANTSIGGSGIGNSRVLNPPPGINKFADTPRGVGSNGSNTEGNGVYHHELLEKPMDIVHFRPGVPRHNPLASFWLNAFNPDAMEAVEYGWIRKAISFVGSTLGFVLTSPYIAVGAVWKTLRSLVLGTNANRYNFYYLSPAPFLFWKGLDDMMNLMAIKLGFTSNVRFSDTEISAQGTLPSETNINMEQIMNMMPGVFSKLDLAGGYRVDTIALGCRYTMMNNMRSNYLAEKSKELFGQTFSTEREYFTALAEWEEELQSTPQKYMRGGSVRKDIENARKVLNGLNEMQSDQTRYESIMGSTDWSGTTGARKSDLSYNIDEENVVTTKVDDEQSKTPFVPPNNDLEYTIGKTTGFQDTYRAVAEGGLDFFSIAVDKVESGSISINNQVGPSSIESMFNGAVGTAKNSWFSASNGNVGDGIVADTAEAVVGGAKAFANSLVNSITGGVQSALFGGKARIDISDVYQDSSTSMPTMSYSFTSQAISGHPLSKLKMMLPVMAILRAASPISGGPRSFMSPYLLAVTHQGRNVCNMGMITSANLEWGGEAGWDINDIPCELKMDFTVTNLDKNFHIPLDSSVTDIHNDEGQWDAMTNILAGASPTDLDRSWSYNIKTNWARSVAKADRFFSSGYLAAALGAGTRSIFEGPIGLMGGYQKWR